MRTSRDGRERRAVASRLARMPTGAKLFLILSAALLPLALIAVVATLQTNRTADEEARAQLRVAIAESSRALGIELIGDMTALRVALNALDIDARDAPSCARAQGVFAQQLAAGGRFMIADRLGRVLCGSDLGKELALDAPAAAGPISARIFPARGIVLSMAGTSGVTTASAFFPTGMLASIGRPTGFTPPYAADLQHDDDRLNLQALADHGPLDRRERMRASIGIGELFLEMSVRNAPISSPLLIAMLLPIVMWLAAAGITWLVVDRLMVYPLRRLRANVSAYRPGEEIDMGEIRSIPSQEIRELGDTFRTISRTVALHEADLAEGLVRQTRLTREVHHRVKNNLQIIASLINFHARGARSAEVVTAYASIQRRVDALAVVHRNHFAEMEENRGLSLRAVIGELASNIRATAPDESARMGIVLDVEPFLINQDVAIAVAFIITEIVELAMLCIPDAQIRISARADAADDRAILRLSSPGLIACAALQEALDERYGRVLEGLSRQLRSQLHHEELSGAFEISIAIIGRD
ncbi:sensor histidine kinase [Hephaestia sp. GCM10023244]|uniref:sensor histidine kinase n=1 Tax=unclassified Hephaestia TaxID=2631281 RepID=UPI002076E48F|nr:sensor histidine kinase [Hephaestia sp. MAHUQ-44]MCM8730693.1 sensor histidine kinase [Hephaestia sp. MAHUQ-44]